MKINGISMALAAIVVQVCSATIWPHSPEVSSMLQVGRGHPEKDYQHYQHQQERKDVLIGYLSAVVNQGRRKAVRETCFSDIRAHSWEPLFFLGRPKFPTQEEVDKWTYRIAVENQTFGDLRMLPVPDDYTVLTEKVAGIMDFGLENGFGSVYKIDDDQCPNVNVLEKATEVLSGGTAVYGGKCQIYHAPAANGTAYYNGHCYFMSAAQVRAIFETERANTIAAGPPTESEDINMGKWVAYTEHRHTDDLEYKRVWFKDFCNPIAGVEGQGQYAGQQYIRPWTHSVKLSQTR